MTIFRYTSGGGVAWRHAVVALATLVTFAGAGPANADNDSVDSGSSKAYAGVSAGAGRIGNRLIDVDGFANWGNPGSMVDYDDRGFVGGVLIGRKFELDGTPLRMELDVVFGGLSASSDAGAGVDVPLDPEWTLRLEGSYLDFGRNTYYVNHSANNTCGRGGPRRACPYDIENRLGVVRLAIIRRFGP